MAHLEVAKMPLWLHSLHSGWVRRNESHPGKGLAFDEYVVNRDDLEKFIHNCDLELVKIRLGQGTLCNEFNEKMEGLRAEISALRQQVEDLRRTEELKEPRSQEAFDAIRQTLFSFNKRNTKQHVGEKKTWGKDNEFDLISSRKSLEAWLKSKHANMFGLDINVIDHFNVCVVKGELATIGREFEGGLGIEAFWIPQDKYDRLKKRSGSYSADSVRRDPRHGYMLNGVKWVPSGGKQKKRRTV